MENTEIEMDALHKLCGQYHLGDRWYAFDGYDFFVGATKEDCLHALGKPEKWYQTQGVGVGVLCLLEDEIVRRVVGAQPHSYSLRVWIDNFDGATVADLILIGQLLQKKFKS